MMLQALCQHYETLCRLGKFPRLGWDVGFKVSFGLDLSDSGEILNLLDFRETQTRGKNSSLLPRSMSVPAHVVRSGRNYSANFLCDNAKFILGVSEKPEDNLVRFQNTSELHYRLLNRIDIPAAKAVLAFFERWNPDQAKDNPRIAEHWDDILKNPNLIFCYEKKTLTEYPKVCMAWDKYYAAKTNNPNAYKAQCLVTGEVSAIAAIHPRIKGVKGAKSVGATLVSFNNPAFRSHGHKKNYNAPVSEHTAFAYTAALNALLADWEHRTVVGDTTVVCWAEHGSESYQNVAFATMFGSSNGITGEEVAAFLNAIVQGSWIDIDGISLNPDERFYILGLAPNSARIYVRFFLQDTFGNFMNNISKHYEDISDVAPSYGHYKYLSLSRLIKGAVKQIKKDESEKDSKEKINGKEGELEEKVLLSILTGEPYPDDLIYGAQMRTRAEQTVTSERAAIIKCYYLRRPNIPFPREVLTMEGKSASTNIPYTLGRLFSVLENIQKTAYPKLNKTIKDKYFGSASSTPANTFPLLINLAQMHLRVIRHDKIGLAVYLEKKIQEYTVIIGENYPARLTLPEQGAFQLGYYFETQSHYSGKTENREIKEEN